MKLLPIFFLFLAGCTSVPFFSIQWPEIEAKSDEIHRGQAKKVEISWPKEKMEDFEVIAFKCDGQKVGHIMSDDSVRLVLSAPYYYDEDIFSCYVELAKENRTKSLQVAMIRILPYQYQSERLNVDRRFAELSDEDLARWQSEREQLEEVYSRLAIDRVYFSEAFRRPLNSVITSPYGRERVFNDSQTSWHNGVDFRAWYDTPIPSSNRGRVIFTGDLFFNGKTVIVDHGLGIITLYCHLNEIKVEVGQIVEKGQLLGLSGNTGRSTAPHLHWGVKVAGNWINGLTLIEQFQ